MKVHEGDEGARPLSSVCMYVCNNFTVYMITPQILE